jgi:hypothetical protein
VSRDVARSATFLDATISDHKAARGAPSHNSRTITPTLPGRRSRALFGSTRAATPHS